LEKSKFYKEKGKTSKSQNKALKGYSYAQALKSTINNIIKIKDNFSNFSTKKIEEIHNALNKPKKNKSQLNMMTKSSSRKQVLVLISMNNLEKIMKLSNKHVANINRTLKNIKSDIMADFIHADNRGLTITTNKVASTLDLNTIKKYIKNVNVVDLDNVRALSLPQSKLYLNILGISYLIKDMNISISADIVKTVLKLTHFFNDIILVSKPCVIKASPKSDIN